MPFVVTTPEGATRIVDDVAADLEKSTTYRVRAMSEPGEVSTAQLPLTIDPHPSALFGAAYQPDLYTYPLVGEAEKAALAKAVPFAGSALAAFEGMEVEGRQVSTSGHATPWQSLGVVAGGRYSGSVDCPARPWVERCFKEVRLASDPGNVVQSAAPHRVQYAVAIGFGRSTVAMIVSHFIKLNATDADVVEPITAAPVLARPGQVSVISAANNSMTGGGGTTSGTKLVYGLLKAGRVAQDALTQDSYKLIANQWARFSDLGLLLIDHSRVSNGDFPLISDVAALYGQQGTSGIIAFRQASHGAETGHRPWSDDYPLTAAQSWGADDAGWIAREQSCLDEAYYGPSADVPAMYIGVTRNTVWSMAEADLAMAANRALGAADPVAVPDLRGQNNGHNAHALPFDRMGTPRAAPTWGTMAARLLGLDSSSNPYYGRAMFSADRTQIHVQVHAANGGALSSPAPAAIMAFRITEPAGSAAYGYTGVLVGDIVTLTKDSGAWAEGTTVSNWAGPDAPSAGTAQAGETALVKGQVYETWTPDILGLGLTVMGAMGEDGWTPNYSRVVEEYDPVNFWE